MALSPSENAVIGGNNAVRGSACGVLEVLIHTISRGIVVLYTQPKVNVHTHTQTDTPYTPIQIELKLTHGAMLERVLDIMRTLFIFLFGVMPPGSMSSRCVALTN